MFPDANLFNKYKVRAVNKKLNISGRKSVLSLNKWKKINPTGKVNSEEVWDILRVINTVVKITIILKSNNPSIPTAFMPR